MSLSPSEIFRSFAETCSFSFDLDFNWKENIKLVIQVKTIKCQYSFIRSFQRELQDTRSKSSAASVTLVAFYFWRCTLRSTKEDKRRLLAYKKYDNFQLDFFSHLVLISKENKKPLKMYIRGER